MTTTPTYEPNTPLSAEQLATVERFGLDGPDADDWVVHVIGPDDVLPATGMLDAIRQAHSINAAAVEPGGYYGEATEDRPFMSFAWAVPSMSGWLK